MCPSDFPSPSVGAQLNVWSPTGSTDPIGPTIKGGITGLASRGMTWLKSIGKPDYSVVEAAPGDYRLLRKGQEGFEQLRVIGRAPAAVPQPTYTTPHAARIQVVPGPASADRAPPAATAPNGPEAELTALIARIGAATYGSPDRISLDAVRTGENLLHHPPGDRVQQEAAILKDISDLVRLAEANSLTIDLAPEGQAPNDVSKAFGKAVAKLLVTRLPGAAVLVNAMLAQGTDEDRMEAAAGHAAKYSGGQPVTDAKLVRALCGGERNLAGTQALQALQDGGTLLTESVQMLGSNLLKLQNHGLLTPELLRGLGGFRPLTDWAHSADPMDHLSALPALAQTVAALAHGYPGTVDNVLADDSRADALALALKQIDAPATGPEREVIGLQHSLSRAKRALAQQWQQSEVVEGAPRFGLFGSRATTRMGQVINAGGSDALHVDTRLLRTLRLGIRSNLDARDGYGMKADPKAGKQLNLLIANVMLLQKHLVQLTDQLPALSGSEAERNHGPFRASAAATPAQARFDEAYRALQARICGNAPPSPAVKDALAALSSAANLPALSKAILARRTYNDMLELQDKLRTDGAAAKQVLFSPHGEHSQIAEALRPHADASPLAIAREMENLLDRQNRLVAAAMERLPKALLDLPLGRGDLDRADLREAVQALHFLTVAVRQAASNRMDRTLGLSQTELVEMGFSEDEAREALTDLRREEHSQYEPLFTMGQVNTREAARVAEAVNNGVQNLFRNGTSAVTQSTMAGLVQAFPEAQAKQFLQTTLAAMEHGSGSGQAPNLNKVPQVFQRVFQAQSAALQAREEWDEIAKPLALRHDRINTLVNEADQLTAEAQRCTRDLNARGQVDPTSSTVQENASRLRQAQHILSVRDALAQEGESLATSSVDLRLRHHQEMDNATQQVATARKALVTAQTSKLTAETGSVADLETVLATKISARDRLARQHQSESVSMGARQATNRESLDDVDASVLQALSKLGRMDQASLANSFWNDAPIRSVGELRSFLKNRAEDIDQLCTLQDYPTALQSKLNQMAQQAKLRDGEMEIYRARLEIEEGSGLRVAQLETAIRFAVIEAARDWPDGPASFSPAEHRTRIEARLQEFGLSLDVARPVIESVLCKPFAVGQIDTWSRDALAAFDATQAQPNLARRALGSLQRFVTDNSKLDPGLRTSFVDGVRAMREGDCISLVRGKTFGMDTTRIPIDATGNLRARATLDLKGRNAMEVRRTEEGFEVFFKAGVEKAASLSLIATFYGAASLSGTGMGGHTGQDGAGFRFESADRAAEFVDAVLGGGKLTPKHWLHAKEVVTVSDNTWMVGAKSDLQVNAKNLIEVLPGSSVVQHMVYDNNVLGTGVEFLGGIQLKVQATGEWRTAEQQNANRRIIERERTVTLEGLVSIGLWSSLPTLGDVGLNYVADSNRNVVFNAINSAVNNNHMLDGAPGGMFAGGAQNYGQGNQVFDPFSPAPSKMATFDLGAKRETTSGNRLEFDSRGLLADAAKTRSIVVMRNATGTDLALLRPNGPDTLLASVNGMAAGPAGLTMLREVLAKVGPGGSLSVSYTLKPESRDLVNDMLVSARKAEAAEDDTKARQQAKMARAIYEDDSNYAVDTITVTNPTNVDNSQTLFSLGIVSGGRLSQGTAERPSVILALPGGATARRVAERNAPPPQPPAVPRPQASGIADLGTGSLTTGDTTGEAVGGTAAPQAAMPDVVLPDVVLPDAVPPGTSSTGQSAEATVPGSAGPVLLNEPEPEASGGPSRPLTPLEQHVGQVTAQSLQSLNKVPKNTMYVENQVAEACGVHAINAFLGGRVITIDQLTNHAKALRVPGSVRTDENDSIGFMPTTVRDVLATAAQAPAFKDRNWAIGISDSFNQQTTPNMSVQLPNLDGTDRLILQVGLTTKERTEVGAREVSHFVTFRRDDKDNWVLLDSQNRSINGALAENTRVAKSVSQQIEPQAWLDRFQYDKNTKLLQVVAIGPGITDNALVIRDRAHPGSV